MELGFMLGAKQITLTECAKQRENILSAEQIRLLGERGYLDEASNSNLTPNLDKIIQKGELSLPSGRPAQQEIRVTYSFDENQIMHCKFVDVASGREEVFALSLNSHSAPYSHCPSINPWSFNRLKI